MVEGEVSLKAWCDRLPKIHRVNKELNKIKETLISLNSMLMSGSTYSDRPRKQYEEALDILIGNEEK